MSIPIQMPPPSDAAIGWTPNALGPPIAQIVQTFVTTAAAPAIIAASSFSAIGSRIVVLRRRLNSTELDSVAGTLFTLATVSGGAALFPMMAIMSASNASAAGYNTTGQLGVRPSGGAADLLTISSIANTVGPTSRVLVAPVLTATAGTIAVASGNLSLRQNIQPIFLGVAGTDSNNYVEISVACLVVIP